MAVRGLSDFLAGRGVGGVVTCGSEIDCSVVPGSNMGNVAAAVAASMGMD
jgi:hypothetical protein